MSNYNRFEQVHKIKDDLDYILDAYNISKEQEALIIDASIDYSNHNGAQSSLKFLYTLLCTAVICRWKNG